MTMDKTKRMGDLEFQDVCSRHRCPLRRRQRLVRLLDLGAVAVTAESVGAMSRAHEITTQYAKNRIQFGAPIGKYQGVKHPRRDAR